MKLKKEENSTELQKANIQAEVSDNSKKCDWGKKKKKQQQKFKRLIGFLSANKIDNYNVGGGGRKEKEKKIQ